MIIILLIAANAIFVAAEFSTISSRPAKLSQMADQGSEVANTILKIVEDPKKLDAYVATCQVGITISSLVLGFYGQASLSDIVASLLVNLGSISKLAADSISATLILIILSIFQILLGELVPKNIGIQYPERLTTMTSPIMKWSGLIFKPLIWLFNGSGVLLMRLFRIEPDTEYAHIHSPEEISILVDESGSGGVIKGEEHRLLKNTLEMRKAQVKQIMIPRTRILSAPETISYQQLLSLVADSPYSRVPIYKDTIDNIIGIIHLRELLCFTFSPEEKKIREIIHPVPFVPEKMLVKDILSLLQRRHLQVAIVMDEFGGTAGMVTLEDLIEQIFGDLQDEFDPVIPAFRLVAGDQIWIQGGVNLSVVNEILSM
ncbi:MAG: hemolysin family protein, partial [Anaerolineaceae bacterium]|nr:hemolysin family protein [Anaerolineaceae bacterium]